MSLPQAESRGWCHHLDGVVPSSLIMVVFVSFLEGANTSFNQERLEVLRLWYCWYIEFKKHPEKRIFERNRVNVNRLQGSQKMTLRATI
jgi:hypothetical protein